MRNQNIFIIGANGQLGTALRQKYPEAKTADVDQLDITSQQSVDSYDWNGTDVIINAAAYTNVDGAETPEGRRAAWSVNATAVANLARVALTHNLTLVHISSDYVFDGTTELHTEDEPFSPLGVYGQTKAAGDIAASLAPKHYIIRTSWVIGDGNNFVRTMKSLAERDIQPSVVSDQIGRLTFTSTLAAGIKHLVNSSADFGTYNLTNSGQSGSWADIAKIVYKKSGKLGEDVTPITTAEYYAGKENIAPRPLQSILDLAKIEAAGFSPPDWRDELDNYMEEL
jgi:dTDP-4-dehydrorhamnose reductase